eukprot:6492441-Amphidinium_carterae.2
MSELYLTKGTPTLRARSEAMNRIPSVKELYFLPFVGTLVDQLVMCASEECPEAVRPPHCQEATRATCCERETTDDNGTTPEMRKTTFYTC